MLARVGALVARIAPLRVAVLASWRFAGAPPTGRFRAALFHHTLEAVLRRYRRDPDPSRRETLKLALMAQHAAAWVHTYDTDARPVPAVFRAADALLTTLPACRVVEIGCGSGKHLAWLAIRHPRHTFVGTDALEPVIAYARRYGGPRLTFQTTPAVAIRPLAPRVVLAVGALTYVQPEHLASLAANLAPPVDLLALEPFTAPGAWRGNFSWSHDYPRVFADWRVLTWQVEAGNALVHVSLTPAATRAESSAP